MFLILGYGWIVQFKKTDQCYKTINGFYGYFQARRILFFYNTILQLDQISALDARILVKSCKLVRINTIYVFLLTYIIILWISKIKYIKIWHVKKDRLGFCIFPQKFKVFLNLALCFQTIWNFLSGNSLF